MKKIVFIILPLFLFGKQEAPLNEIESLIDNKHKKIFILDKKDLNDVLVVNKPFQTAVIDNNNNKSLKIKSGEVKEIIINSDPIEDVKNNTTPVVIKNSNIAVPLNKELSKGPSSTISVLDNNNDTKNKANVLTSSLAPVVPVVDNITNYNEYINSLKSTNKKNINMSFGDLIKATKYLFDNNLEEKYKVELKPELLQAAKKIENIDMLFFEEALNNMNKQTINELASNLGEI